jgi:flagella basal body P-ring formation protein FlgA
LLGGIIALLATTSAAPLAAQSRTPSWSPGPALEARVREAVAARWETDPAALRLEWGNARAGAEPAAEAEFELIGEGVGGNWIVVFAPHAAREPALRVWLRAGVEVAEPVAARRLERDHVLEPADIAAATRVSWGPPATDGAAVRPGWTTRRQVRAGEPLREPAVAPPLAVRTGEVVQAVWQRAGVALSLPARALGSAVVGARVQVRTESGRRLEGVATELGLVEIDVVPEVKR